MNKLCCLVIGVNTAVNDVTDAVENRIMKMGDYLCYNGLWVSLWVAVIAGCTFMIGRMSV